jgi:PilZ domain
MDEPEDKRATRRFSLKLPISVKYQNGEAREKSAVTRDVSARGVCFNVDSPIEEGAQIEFTLTLPPEITMTESIHVRCKGRVVRSAEPGPSGELSIAAIIDEYEFLSGG